MIDTATFGEPKSTKERTTNMQRWDYFDLLKFCLDDLLTDRGMACFFTFHTTQFIVRKQKEV